LEAIDNPSASEHRQPFGQLGAIGAANPTVHRNRLMSLGRLLGIATLSVTFAACGKSKQPAPADTLAISRDSAQQAQQTNSGRPAMSFTLSSPAFAPNGPIPSKYTCEGADISPPLKWSGAPDGTRSFALIVDDPDAPDPAKPQRVFVHWVVYNIPSSTNELPENASKTGLPPGAMQGTNDFGKQAYGGPCPPIGRHRYFFKLYALDSQLKGLVNPTKAQLESAIRGHTLDNTQLIGTYEKKKK
jgi:Raf kinase inhibitor-like YbhB/YbcL family protein